MATFKTIITLAIIATSSTAYADDSIDNPVSTYQPVYQSSYTGADYTNPGYTGAGYTGQTGYGQK